MGAARGALSSPRRLPLLSVLLLPLLGGESRRAEGAREPRAPEGATGRWAWAAGAGETAGRGAGACWWGEIPAAGRRRSPRTLGRGPSCLAPTRTRFQPPRSFPGLSREFCSVTAGSCRFPGPGRSFLAGESDYPPLRGVQRGSWRWGRRNPRGRLSLGEGGRPGAGCRTDLRRAGRGALLPTPARCSLLPSSKFLGQAGTPTVLLVRAGEGKS